METTLPLTIHATEGKESVDYLKGWIAQNKSWLEAKMLEHGKTILLKLLLIKNTADKQITPLAIAI